MDLEICGYMSFLLDFTVQTYGFIFWVIFLVCFLGITNENYPSKVAGSLVIALTIAIILPSIMFVSNQGRISVEEYSTFEKQISAVLIDNSHGFNREEISALQDWVVCANSDKKITEYEFSQFNHRVDKLRKKYQQNASHATINNLIIASKKSE